MDPYKEKLRTTIIQASWIYRYYDSSSWLSRERAKFCRSPRGRNRRSANFAFTATIAKKGMAFQEAVVKLNYII